MHLVLRKCYNQKILSNHPMKICPFWGISDRKLKFRYLKPQVNIWKCKINSLNEILNKILPKKFIFGDSILIVAQQETFFFLLLILSESRHKIKDFYKQSSFPQTFFIHPTSSIQKYVVWFVYISFIRLN